MLIPEFPLRTKRLLFRPYAEGDLDFLYELESRPDVRRYVTWPEPDREQTHRSLLKKITETELLTEGDNLTPLLVLPDTGEPVGDVQMCWTSLDHMRGELGYVIHPDHAGRGYATEAAELMLRLGFSELGLHRIEARVDSRNVASARVLERLGMRREGRLVLATLIRGEWADELVYAILADEWRARH